MSRLIITKQTFNNIAFIIFLIFCIPFVIGFAENMAIKIGETFSNPVSREAIVNLRNFHNLLAPLYDNFALLLVGIVVLINLDDLEGMNIDAFFFQLYFVASLSYSIYNFWPLGWFVFPFSVFLYVYMLKKKSKANVSINSERVSLFIILTFFFGLLIIWPSLDEKKIRLLVYTIATYYPFTLVEEFIFRAISYQVLKSWGWKTSVIFITQASLFWFIHVNRLFLEPDYFWWFWVGTPILSIFFGVITWRCKSISPAFLAHYLSGILLVLVL